MPKNCISVSENRDLMRSAGISRREFLGAAVAAAGTAVLGCGRRSGRQPNVLLILTDDQGWADIGINGNPVLETPVLDRLAVSGVSFERFLVDPVCAPTRAGLLTGRYALRCGVTGVTRGKETMRAEEVTLGDMFSRAGYATGCFGKWHNGAHYPYHPLGRGFDRFTGFCAGHWNNYFDTTLDRDGSAVATSGYITDVITDEALGFIEANQGRPWFCYIPYNAPHSPFQVPEKYFAKYRGRGCSDELACVYGMVENLDENIGKVLDRLARLGLEQDTIVVFLTDNGPNTDRPNGGMRARKGSVHEGGVRVPCFIRWPGHLEPGVTIERVAAHIDMLPTLAALTGVETEPGPALDGWDLSALLLGTRDTLPERLIFTSQGNQGAVRSAAHRLVLSGSEPTGLFDIISDPGETTDISAEKPELVRELAVSYREWRADVTSQPQEAPPVPVGYERIRTVTLPGHEAHLDGSLRYRGGASGWANDYIVGWSGSGAALWHIDVVAEGDYVLELLYTCPQKDSGSTFRVKVGDESLESAPTLVHDPDPLPSPDRVPRIEVYEKEWASLPLGTAYLRKGEIQLCLEAARVNEDCSVEIKAVRLERKQQ